jgi:hypothetical protein
MDMKKVYKNIFGETVSKAEALKLNEYHLYYYLKDSGLLKQIDFVSDVKIYNINYFLHEEDENEVFNDLKEKSSFFDIEKREIIDHYIVTTNKLYSLTVNEEPLISKSVFYTTDPENFICSQVIDNETLEPVFDRTTKCWYTADENGERYAAIEFSYQEDGKLELAIDKTPNRDDDQEWEYYEYATFKKLQDKIPEDISYYKTSELLPKITSKK